MKISDLVNNLRLIMAQEGDLDVVTGLDRSGYGEEIIDTSVRTCKTFNESSGEMDGPPLKVVTLKSDDISMVEL